MVIFNRFNVRFLLTLFLLIPIGIATKRYTGVGESWIQFYFGGVIYEIFWCVFFAFLISSASALRIVVWVLVVTCVLEFLQLWHPPFLEWIRATFLGRALFGSSFSWLDFRHYFLGCILGFFWTGWTRRRSLLPLFKDR